MTDAPLHMSVRLKRGDFSIDATLDAGPGVTALFGRSGVGKSTVVAMLAGLLKPNDGVIRVAGETLFDSQAGVNVAPEHRGVGCVFQDPRLFPHLSVAQNLKYGLNRLSPAKRADTFAKVVDLLGLKDLLDRRPAGLSGGEKQRTAIGRALLSNPRILLMDEPLANLDAARKSEILPYVERLSADFGVPVVYVSHAMEEVVRLADTLVLIDAGRVKAHGPVEDLLARLDLTPLTGRYEAGAVLNATVAGHDDDVKLTRLDMLGHTLFTPRVNLSLGETVRLRVRARDVSLALTPPAGTSILNQIPVTVAEVELGSGPHAEVALSVTPKSGAQSAKTQTVLARVTKKSYQDLGLARGMDVYALIKAVAIDRHSLGGLGTGAERNTS